MSVLAGGCINQIYDMGCMFNVKFIAVKNIFPFSQHSTEFCGLFGNTLIQDSES